MRGLTGRHASTPESLGKDAKARPEKMKMGERASAACRLQKEKMVCYTHERVTVLDRNRLEATAYACYGVAKADGLRAGL